jgi:signal transduction histidine kinase
VIFQRLNDRATYPGTGIGLAMCRKIIEYFGGRIWLDTGTGTDTDTGTDTAAEGAGAVFRFTLPVLPEYPSLRSQPELPQVQESHG